MQKALCDTCEKELDAGTFSYLHVVMPVGQKDVDFCSITCMRQYARPPAAAAPHSHKYEVFASDVSVTGTVECFGTSGLDSHQLDLAQREADVEMCVECSELRVSM